VAFDVLEPSLRSRGSIGAEVQALYEDHGFRTEMEAVFRSEPTGRLVLPTLSSLSERVADLERRLRQIELQNS
jgi:hypothetical protein